MSALLVVDLPVSSLDINQCEPHEEHPGILRLFWGFLIFLFLFMFCFCFSSCSFSDSNSCSNSVYCSCFLISGGHLPPPGHIAAFSSTHKCHNSSKVHHLHFWIGSLLYIWMLSVRHNNGIWCFGALCVMYSRNHGNKYSYEMLSGRISRCQIVILSYLHPFFLIFSEQFMISFMDTIGWII